MLSNVFKNALVIICSDIRGYKLPNKTRFRNKAWRDQIIGFYVYSSVYLTINGIFVLGWWFSGAGVPWFIFPLDFWGIGLVAHFVGVFGGTDMSDRMAQREYERLKHGREY